MWYLKRFLRQLGYWLGFRPGRVAVNWVYDDIPCQGQFYADIWRYRAYHASPDRSVNWEAVK